MNIQHCSGAFRGDKKSTLVTDIGLYAYSLVMVTDVYVFDIEI